ncbi:MAG: heparan-alpha-glucosaminide N-acetyltransferase domain-containing protein [Bryobacteraceae bacterium]
MTATCSADSARHPTPSDPKPPSGAARLPFLDWTRGLAVVIMIECHVYNAYTRLDLRAGGAYVLSQFVGGMGAVLFLFLAGMTFAFQMERLERRAEAAPVRLRTLLRRAGYLFLIAYLFRISNTLFSMPNPPWSVLLKVDILNCMGLAMTAMAPCGLLGGRSRIRAAAVMGLVIAAASPLIANLDWKGVPTPIRDYLKPNRAMFPFFPWAAYLAFGVAWGTVIRRLAPERLERALQWSVLAGFGLIFGAQYFSNLPYSLYPQSDFWTDSPALVLMRVGMVLVAMAGAYVWTEHAAGSGWSWVQTLGKTSLLVYWVHVMIVYGWLMEGWKKRLDIPQATLLLLAVMAAMVALAEARLRWKGRPIRVWRARLSSTP